MQQFAHGSKLGKFPAERAEETQMPAENNYPPTAARTIHQSLFPYQHILKLFYFNNFPGNTFAVEGFHLAFFEVEG